MRFSHIYNWYTTGMAGKYQLGNRQHPEATGHLEESKNFFIYLKMYRTLTRSRKITAEKKM